MAKLTQEEILSYLEEATILELNDLVSAIEEKFGVVAAAAVAAPAAAAEEAAGPSEVTVTLTDVGFDTPITLNCSCSQADFAKYTKILRKTFKENNKRFDQYHAYKNMNNLYTLNHEAYNHPIQMDETFIDCLKLAMKMQSKNSQNHTERSFQEKLKLHLKKLHHKEGHLL